MKFDSNDIWHDIPVIDILDDSIPTDNSVFRINLDTFVCCWESFSSMSTTQKRDRLSQIFNIDYFDSATVLTNVDSLEKLKKSGFYDRSPADQSGFIYIYTFEDNVLAGLYEQGLFWWKTRRYEAKLKIGRTEQNVFRRIDQQFDNKTGISEPPILLAVFWTKLVVQCERGIHNELIDKRLKDKEGNVAKGGVEWFKDTPTQILPIVLKWVKHCNDVLLGYHPETCKPIYAKIGRYGSYVQLGPKQSSLPKGMKLEDVTLEIAVELLKPPRSLEVHRSWYRSKEYRSLKATDDVLTITLERALAILAEPKAVYGGKKEPLRTLGNHPDDNEPVAIFAGPYFKYIKHGKINVGLPEGETLEGISLETALSLLVAKGGTVKKNTIKAKTTAIKAKTTATKAKTTATKAKTATTKKTTTAKKAI